MRMELINLALENLYQNTGIKGRVTKGNDLNGNICLEVQGEELTYIVEAKKELRRHQLLALKEHKNKMFPKEVIVVAEHIFPKLKKELRELNIPYLELNGNVFIKNKKVLLFIDTNKKVELKKERGNRAFTKTGLKVVLQLLIDKGLINRPQREIAKLTGVSLGNIPQVIDGLKETGYLLKLKKHEYIWQNREELLERWINDYATQLRPRIIKGTYTMKKDWETLRFKGKDTLWGGEVAADKLTQYLRPEHFILYTKEDQFDLVKNYHFIPKPKGELEVLELFFKTENGFVPPILIYAELLLTGGKRNRETAEIIYNKHVKPIL